MSINLDLRNKRQIIPDFSNLFGNAGGLLGGAGGGNIAGAPQPMPGVPTALGTSSGFNAFGTGQQTNNNVGLGPGGFSTG